MMTETKRKLTLGLSVGLLTLLIQGPFLNTNESKPAYFRNGIYLNGLKINGLSMNTSKNNIIDEVTTINYSAQTDWINPSETQVNSNEGASIGEQNGQLVVQFTE